MLPAVERVTKQPNAIILHHLRPYMPCADWPTKQAFTQAFIEKAQQIASQRQVSDWHQLSKQDWEQCAQAAQNGDRNGKQNVS